MNGKDYGKKKMKTYKVFIKKDDHLKSIFMSYIFQEGTNIKTSNTPGFYSWETKKQAERFRDTLVVNYFETTVIKEVEVTEFIKEKVKLYTKKDQKKFHVKKSYGISICSETVIIK